MDKPAFDPSQPFEPIEAPAPPEAGKPPFDPGKPFEAAQQAVAPEQEPAPPQAAAVPTPTPEETPDTPGFWGSIGSAYSKGLAEQAASDVAGTKIILPKGMGGSSFEEQSQDATMHPQTKDAVDKLLEQPISQGYTDPKWWGTQLAKGAGNLTPGLGSALAASAVGGPIAGIGAFALESGVSRLLPAYNAAKASGLNSEDAIKRSLIDTGITASFATAMGFAPVVPVGRIAGSLVNETVADLLSRPVADAMIQIGLVQPSLMVSQDIVTDLSHGETPNAEQVLTDVALGTLTGLGLHETFRSADRVKALMDARAEMTARRAPPEPVASAATIAAAAEAQRPKGATDIRPETKAEPAAPVGPPPSPQDDVPMTGEQYDRDVTPRPGQEPFFSAVYQAIDKMPERMNGASVLNFLSKQPGVSRGELAWLGVKDYLKDVDGQVNKKDLRAHVESRQVQIEEVEYKEPSADPMAEANALYDKYTAQYGAQHQWPVGAQRHYSNVRDAAFDARQAAREHEPRFPGQNPPDAQNIKEYVLKTPAPEIPPAVLEAKARDLWDYNNSYRYGPWDNLPEENKADYRKYAAQHIYADDPTVYTGNHHQVPNGFAHMRLADYVDHNGRKILMMVEGQSDIHQRAEREGLQYQERGVADPRIAERAAGTARDVYSKALLAEENRLRAAGKSPTTAILNPEVRTLRNAWLKANDAWDAANKAVYGKSPALPFKTEWQELLVKRLLQLGADGGYDGVSILNGDQVGLRLATREQLKGARENYDNTFQNLLKKWAKKVGSTTEPTRIVAFQRDWAQHIDRMQPIRRVALNKMLLDPEAMKVNMWMPVGAEHSSIIQKGMPLWDKDIVPGQGKGTRTLSEVVQDNPNWRHLVPVAKKIDTVIGKLANEFRVGRGISILHTDLNQPWRGRLKEGWDPATGNYMIEVNMRRILTPHDLYAAMSHEFGHVLYKELYEKASDAEKAALNKAYNDFRAKIPSEDLTVGDVRRIRDNAISETTGARDAGKELRISDLDPTTKAYLLGKYEWWAEQVAKWMTTDEKPMALADKFLKRVANKIRKMIAAFTKTEHGPNAKPDQAVQDFLNNKYGIKATWMEAPTEQFEMDTKKKAAAAFDKEGAPETKAVPQQASSAGGRDIIAKLPPDQRGNGEAMAAHGDRMNWFFNLFTSLPQIQQLNKHIRSLAEYTDLHRLADLMRHEITGAAYDRDKQWAMIRDPKQLEGLTNFISDYARGLFKLPHTEDGVFRRPNAEEFTALVKKHGLSDQSVRLFQGITTDFDNFLERYRKLLIDDAWKIKDDTRRKNTMANINATMDKLLQRPFMPMTRFGKYSITVYGADGKIRHYEQTNTLRQQKKIAEALAAHADRLPGDKVLTGMVPKDVRPFLGMPPGLIDLISDKLSLSKTQRDALDQLKFDYAPAQTFKHQFRNLDLTPGWSTDYRRAYANFFFHGATHVARISFADKMRAAIAATGSQAERLQRVGQPGGSNKLDKIVKYMQAHFDAFIDPKSDWAAVRGIMFHWYLGFNPASAVTNLTQTPLMTHPYLASIFGDVSSARAILKASTDLNNFYKKTTLSAAADAAKDSPGYEAARSRAFGLALKYGTLTETQTHQLAAQAEDRNLMRVFGTPAEKFWLKFQDASSWMFSTSEEWNRRVAFASAWDLAYNSKAGHKAIQDAVATHPLVFKELTNPKERNMTAHEAGAFLTAMKAVDQTQFNYSPFARPPIMRGKLGGTALVFKLFTQNSLFNLVSNPSMLWRWTLIMGALGGMQGLMGFDNVNSLLKTIAYRAFGKDFDLEDEARKFAHDVLNDVISPDILMHGLSAKGFGIPHIMHSMGLPFPTVDLSKSIGMGDVLGFDPFKPLGPVKQPRDETFKQLTRAAGAAFSLPLNLYDFASSNDNLTSLKRYENIMPRWMGSLSHAYRFASEGKEVNQAGNAVVRFDPADTEQMMEILARVGGFQPRRLTEEWGRIQAVSQAAAYWDLRRQGLMRQFADAVKNNDPEGKEKVREAIKNYNHSLPPEAKGKAITGAEITSSIQQRMRVKRLQEQGLPMQKSNLPIAKQIQPYYPKGEYYSSKTVQ